jgi:protease-4
MTTPGPARTSRIPAAVALAILAALLAGCIPSRILIDLAPGDGELRPAIVLKDPGATESGPRIAIIDVIGLISESPTPGLFASGSTAVDSLITRLDAAERDPRVHAVILRINSPGGTVAASEVMYDELRRFRERTGKPIVVSMGEVAASGGYYIALAADHIVAQPSSITASIGVVAQTFNFARGMDRYGIEGRAVVSRPNKDIANPFEPPVEEHYQLIQHMVDEHFVVFRTLVATRRPDAAANAAEFDRLTDGRVVTGAEAASTGLVDSLGTIRDAFTHAKALADLSSAVLVKYHPESSSPPRSAYSVLAPARPAGESDPALAVSAGPFHVQAAGTDRLGPGFYYLWVAPGAP